jgi:dTDP-4-dehydrorhamnose reductase
MRPEILLTGKTGQIGSELLQLLPGLGHVIAPGRQDLDFLDSSSLGRFVRDVRPQLIVNAAAYTAVDAAENDEAKAHTINTVAPGVLAEEAKALGAAMVHYSTDYVFDGRKESPYAESDLTNPINVYGKTKLAGEQAIRSSGVPHLILRTAWVYATRGRNFLLTILRLATQKEELRIVNDQLGSPTWSREIAASTTRILAQLLRQDSPMSAFLHFGGTYHMTAAGQTTWFGFANAILEAAARVPGDASWFAAATGGRPLITQRIVPISTAEYPTPASRPSYSVLSNSRLLQEFGFALPDWRIQLHRCLGVEPQGR